MLAGTTRSRNCSLVDTEVIAINCKKQRWTGSLWVHEIKHDSSRVPRPHSTALLGRGPRKPGVETYSSSEPCTRVASNSVATVTPRTGFSITPRRRFRLQRRPAAAAAFFVTARFALALVTRFLALRL